MAGGIVWKKYRNIHFLFFIFSTTWCKINYHYTIIYYFNHSNLPFQPWRILCYKIRINRYVLFLRCDWQIILILYLFRPHTNKKWVIEEVYSHYWIHSLYFKSLNPVRSGSYWESILKPIIESNKLGTRRKIACWWIEENLTNDKSALVQVMAWCHQATSQCLKQCLPRCLPPYWVTSHDELMLFRVVLLKV